MKILKALLATILLSPLSFNASAKETGIELLETIKFFNDADTNKTETPTTFKHALKYMNYSGYAIGLTVGDNDRTICPPEGITQKQNMLVIEKYLKEHPEELHEPAQLLIDIALMDAFPCEE